MGTAPIEELKVIEQRGDYVIVEVKPSRETGGCKFMVRMAGDPDREYLSAHQEASLARGQIHRYQEGDERRKRQRSSGKPLLHKGKPFRTDAWGRTLQD